MWVKVRIILSAILRNTNLLFALGFVHHKYGQPWRFMTMPTFFLLTIIYSINRYFTRLNNSKRTSIALFPGISKAFNTKGPLPLAKEMFPSILDLKSLT